MPFSKLVLLLGAGPSFIFVLNALLWSEVLKDTSAEVSSQNSPHPMLRQAARKRECLRVSMPLLIQAKDIVGNVLADYRADTVNVGLDKIGSGDGPTCREIARRHAAGALVQPTENSVSQFRLGAENSRLVFSALAGRELHMSGASQTIRELSTAHSPLIFPRDSMRAAVLYEPKGDMKVESLQIPKPKAGEVLVKTKGEGG